jgi:hypothetical protein
MISLSRHFDSTDVIRDLILDVWSELANIGVRMYVQYKYHSQPKAYGITPYLMSTRTLAFTVGFSMANLSHAMKEEINPTLTQSSAFQLEHIRTRRGRRG